MMRILVVHQFYRSANASGENLSVRDEVAALRGRGHEVELLAADSDDLASGVDAVRAGIDAIWSRRGVSRLEEVLDRFRPQIALCENLFPSHSPAVLRRLRGRGIPVVAAVRNFRMDCASGTHFRDGRSCTDCAGSRFNAPAIIHACYQGSKIATAPMAASLRLHRSTFAQIDHFLPVSSYMADFVRTLGVPTDRITVRPNFVQDHGPADIEDHGFLFAGRLSDEKGFGLLLDAWQLSGLGADSRLVVCGDGPLWERALSIASETGIELRGMVTHGEVLAAMAETAVTVVPSLWAEPFGRVAIESASLGRPAVVVPSGGLADIVIDGETGWTVAPRVAAMASVLREAAAVDEARTRGRTARRRFLTNYTESVSVGILEDTLRSLALSS